MSLSNWQAIRRYLLAAIFTALLYNPALATVGETVNFSWLPNSETDLSGYKIHYGTAAGGPYSSYVDVGNPSPVDGRIQGSVSDLTPGETYYFVATAYNTSGLESEYSTEISYICPAGDSNPPSGSIVINNGDLNTQITEVTLTLTATDNESTVAQMQLSNNNVSWSSAENFITSKTWELDPAYGSKTVYVKFADEAGNWSTAYSDHIELVEVNELTAPGTLRIKTQEPVYK